MRAFFSWLLGPLLRRLFPGGVQGDDAAGGWKEPVRDDAAYTVKKYGSTFISDEHGSRRIPPGERDPFGSDAPDA